MKNLCRICFWLVLVAVAQILLGVGLAERFNCYEAVFPAVLLNAGIMISAGIVFAAVVLCEAKQKRDAELVVQESRLWE